MKKLKTKVVLSTTEKAMEYEEIKSWRKVQKGTAQRQGGYKRLAKR